MPGQPFHTQSERRFTWALVAGVALGFASLCACRAWGAPPGELQASADARPGPSDFWSFQPMRAAVLPNVRATNWPRDPLDRFILAQLEASRIAPAEPADRRTLLRRGTLDLTGLPPTTGEIQQFLADEAPDAWERVVDRLLASPRYGERWARHWLDVVRYADARDLIQLPKESDFREVWRYRDWVVDVTNRDLPYDQFLRLQLAGDVLQPADKNRIDAEALVATGFLALADFVPGDVDKQQMIADYVNDQIDVMGRAMLGLTLGCARCHDHKFDPISAEDYYALAGIFFSSRLVPGPVPGNTPLVRVPLLSASELEQVAVRQTHAQRRIVELTAALETAGDEAFRQTIRHEVSTNTGRYLLAIWKSRHAGRDSGDNSQRLTPEGLDPATLDRWETYLERRGVFPAAVPERPERSPLKRSAELLAHVLSSSDPAECEQRVHQLEQGLREAALAVRAQDGADVEVPAELILRADDPNLEIDSEGRIKRWPDGSSRPKTATPSDDKPAPILAKMQIGADLRPVVRFTGQESLRVPRRVPATGSLLIVFRSHESPPAGQRLLGWEDASAGQHGLGLMPGAMGRLHAILRRDGANGDVVVSAPAESEWQLVCATWGPGGVRVYRDGQLVGRNAAIEAVSSDPAIIGLTLGGPGSGAGPAFHGELAELRVYASPLGDEDRQRVEGDLRRRWFETPARTDEASSDPLAVLYHDLIATDGPYWLPSNERSATTTAELETQLAALRKELTQLQQQVTEETPQAVAVQEGGPADTPHAGFHDARVYLRGNPAELGSIVPRGFPQVLAGKSQPSIRAGSGRRELADWVTQADHPLTARVMANRLWQHHLGVGLVRTSTNFGAAGELPSHPELLDHLALRFVDSGWSAKKIHRAIVTSSTYQLSSQPPPGAVALDPENRLMGRANRRRLEAESIRDALLAVADRLDTAQGGPGHLDAASRRRSLYLMTVRTGSKGPDFGPLFDGADGGTVVERRNESVAAPQALYLLNDGLMADLAVELAQRLVRELPSGTDTQRIDRLYEIAFARLPTAEESEFGREWVATAGEADPWSRYCHVILCTNELIYVD